MRSKAQIQRVKDVLDDAVEGLFERQYGYCTEEGLFILPKSSVFNKFKEYCNKNQDCQLHLDIAFLTTEFINVDNTNSESSNRSSRQQPGLTFSRQDFGDILDHLAGCSRDSDRNDAMKAAWQIVFTAAQELWSKQGVAVVQISENTTTQLVNHVYDTTLTLKTIKNRNKRDKLGKIVD